MTERFLNNDRDLVSILNDIIKEMKSMDKDGKEKLFNSFMEESLELDLKSNPELANVDPQKINFYIQEIKIGKNSIAQKYKKIIYDTFIENTEYYYCDREGLERYINDMGSLLPLFPVLEKGTVAVKVSFEEAIQVEFLKQAGLDLLRGYVKKVLLADSRLKEQLNMNMEDQK